MSQIRKVIQNKFDENDIHELINDLILARQTARDNKDYRKSDEIRRSLKKYISINDLEEKGAKWTSSNYFLTLKNFRGKTDGSDFYMTRTLRDGQ